MEQWVGSLRTRLRYNGSYFNTQTFLNFYYVLFLLWRKHDSVIQYRCGNKFLILRSWFYLTSIAILMVKANCIYYNMNFSLQVELSNVNFIVILVRDRINIKIVCLVIRRKNVGNHHRIFAWCVIKVLRKSII